MSTQSRRAYPRLNAWHVITVLSLIFWGVVISEVGAQEYVDITWSWVEPTEREDGTPLLPSEIAGYNLRYDGQPFTNPVELSGVFGAGTTSFSWPQYAGRVTSFSLQTVDTDGRVSEWTLPVIKTAQTPPAPPLVECP